jgi:hypothetical protein
MSESIRVYVNARGLDVPAGSLALDAVRAFDPATADLVAARDRALTDSRGLPVEPDAQLYMGAILRIVSGRRRAPGAP